MQRGIGEIAGVIGYTKTQTKIKNKNKKTKNVNP
jgi:hypothetical protein